MAHILFEQAPDASLVRINSISFNYYFYKSTIYDCSTYIIACEAVATTMKHLLGPKSMDKLITNAYGIISHY